VNVTVGYTELIHCVPLIKKSWFQLKLCCQTNDHI